jgi:LysM repeat protein
VVEDGALRYEVKQGDTCLEIANRFRVSLARLVAYNRFDADTCFLSIGQIVLIPLEDSTVTERATDTVPATQTPAPTAIPTAVPTAIPTQLPTQAPTATSANPQTTYTVRNGDTCGGIARRFGIRVAELAAANGLNTNTCFLRVGQRLVIPNVVVASAPVQAAPTATVIAEVADENVYVVKPGDTCLGIAIRYKLTVARLAAANNLNAKTCFLSVGRRLVIPPPN